MICYEYAATILNVTVLMTRVTPVTVHPLLHVEVLSVYSTCASLTGITSTPVAGKVSVVQHSGSTGRAAQQSTIGRTCVVPGRTLGTPHTLITFLCQHITHYTLVLVT